MTEQILEHDWVCINPGYDSTYECQKCGARFTEICDNPQSVCPKTGCTIETAEEMFSNIGYQDVRKLNVFQLGPCYVGLYRFAFTWGVVYGLHSTGYLGRFCFDNLTCARMFLKEWDGQTLPVVGEDGCVALK